MERERSENETSNSAEESSASPSPSGSINNASSTSKEEENEMFSCNVCFETASDPVVTLCGHLFCWPCIYRWFEVHRSDETTCPVCKSGIAKSTLVPIYGRGKEKVDPRTKIPSRPAGQRSEAPEQASIMGPNDHFLPPGIVMGGMGGGGFQVQFGGFPFMGWGNINFGGGGQQQRAAPANLTPEQRRRMQQDNISQMLLFLGFIVLLWVLPLWRM